MEIGRLAWPIDTGYRRSSPLDLLELRPHMEELVESSAKREIPGNFCYVANLSLTQFPLHPVHENYDLFFKSKGNYLSLPDFPGNLACFRPCWEAPGSCSPKHHALTPMPPWLVFRAEYLLGKTSPGLGVQRKKTASLPPARAANWLGTSLHPHCHSRMGPSGPLAVGRGMLWHGVTCLLPCWAFSPTPTLHMVLIASVMMMMHKCACFASSLGRPTVCL